LEALKIAQKIIRENAFEDKKKKPRLFNPGLSANQPSNNWALVYMYIQWFRERSNPA